MISDSMKKICSFIILISSSLVLAEGRYAGSSLELGAGARPLALAGAAAAMTGSSETFYYNAASIAFVERPVVHLMYAPTFGSIRDPLASYNLMGLSYPLPGGGTVAFNWSRYSVDDIPIYPELRGKSFSERNNDPSLRPDGTASGTFKDVEDVYYFSFARKFVLVFPLGWLYLDMPIEIPVGVNFKLFRQSLYKNNASGMGVDLGSMIRVDVGKFFDRRSLGNLAFGLSFADLTQTNIIWDTKQEDHIRRTFIYGLSYEQKLVFIDAQINIFWTRYKKYERKNFVGAELTYKGLAVRIGQNGNGLTTGAGLSFWHMKVDYAFGATGFEHVHRLSCALSF